jgi:hypothetical protein
MAPQTTKEETSVAILKTSADLSLGAVLGNLTRVLA